MYDYQGTILGSLGRRRMVDEREQERIRAEERERAEKDKIENQSREGGGIGALLGLATGAFTGGALPAVIGGIKGYSAGRAAGATGDNLGAALSGVASGYMAKGPSVLSVENADKISKILQVVQPITEEEFNLLSKDQLADVIDNADIGEALSTYKGVGPDGNPIEKKYRYFKYRPKTPAFEFNLP